MELAFVNGFNLCHVKQIKEVYESVGWSSHDEHNIIEIYNNSTHVSIAIMNNEIVGIARALSDGVYNAAIYDVIVKPKYQSNHIGYQIVENILLEIGNVSCIHLISTLGNCDFYNKLGFRKTTTGMAIYQSEQLRNDYTE